MSNNPYQAPESDIVSAKSDVLLLSMRRGGLGILVLFFVAFAEFYVASQQPWPETQYLLSALGVLLLVMGLDALVFQRPFAKIYPDRIKVLFRTIHVPFDSLYLKGKKVRGSVKGRDKTVLVKSTFNKDDWQQLLEMIEAETRRKP